MTYPYSYIISYTLDTIIRDKYVTDKHKELLGHVPITNLSIAIDFVIDKRLNCFLNNLFADDFVYDIDISIIENID